MTWLESNLPDETRIFKGLIGPYCFPLLVIYFGTLETYSFFQGKDNAHSFLPCSILSLARDYEYNLDLITTPKKSIPSIAIKKVKWSPPPH